MKYCKNCYPFDGIQEYDEFCWICGLKLSYLDEKCSCGNTLSKYDLFCPNCGKKNKAKYIMRQS